MPAKAWPYAVTRGYLTGNQAVLVPRFLADAGLTYVLEYASRQEMYDPDAVTVREVLGAAQTLSVAYRVREARADHYGLGGREVLEDINGRPVRVFEGLVLRRPASEVASLGLTAADLDAAARLAAPSVRKLWEADTKIEAEPSDPILLGNAGPAAWPLNTRIAEPYVVPDSEAEHGAAVSQVVPAVPRIVSRPGRARTGDSRAAAGQRPRPDAGTPPRLPAQREQRVRRPVSRTAIAGIAAAIALLGIALLLKEAFSSPSPPSDHQTATTTVNRICTDLGSGQASDAYQQLSDAYRSSTSLSAFKASLLGSAPTATCTSRTVTPAGDQATLALRRADGNRETAHLTFQDESNQWQATKMSVRTGWIGAPG